MEHRDVLVWLPLAALVALLALAALIDIRERRIPNWLSGGVAALYPVYMLASAPPVAWLGAMAAAAAVFLVGFVLFVRQLIGGGDVKLIAAVTLWAGIEHLALFALVTTLAGGGLALGSLWYRRWQGMIDAHMATLGWSFASAGRAQRMAAPSEDTERTAPPSTGQAATSQPATTLPYAVAIAAGGLAVIAQLAEL